MIAAVVVVTTTMSFTLQDNAGWITIDQNELKELSKKMSAFYEGKKRFSVKVTHQTYKGHHALTPYDQSTGYIKRDGEQFHSLMAGIHTYQDQQFRFVVDSAQQSIIVADKKPFVATETIDWEHVVAQQQVAACRKKKQDKQILFRVDYKKNYQIEATELLVNADHSLAAVTIFFRNEIPVSANDKALKAQPKAKIIFSDYSFTPAFGAGEFAHKNFFTVSNKKLLPTARYKTYQLLDNRISKNQTND